MILPCCSRDELLEEIVENDADLARLARRPVSEAARLQAAESRRVLERWRDGLAAQLAERL